MKHLVLLLALASMAIAQPIPSIKPGKLVYIEAGGDTLPVATLTTVDITALDGIILNIPDWIGKAILKKASQARGRLIVQWTPQLQSDSTIVAIPTNPDSLIMFIARRPYYLPRIELDAQVE